jgi:protein-S-isoprenylcysteine O-methyltransferase Ste14
MDHIRYFLGVAMAIVIPLGVLYWLIIHSWARWWRRWGPVSTYCAVLPVLAAVGVLLFHVRGELMGANLGTNWNLIGIALIVLCLDTWIEAQYWRQLSISTLVGIPELSQRRKGTLLRTGIYALVRHPRYLSAGIGLVGTVLIVNYRGLYILAVSVLPPGYLALILEERELRDRFGDAYRRYQREVPQLIPRLREIRKSIRGEWGFSGRT